MSHPVGTHINKNQDHELEYWLRKNEFSQSEENKEVLRRIIDDAKKANGLRSNDHLTHDTLDQFFEKNKQKYSLD